MDWLCSKSVQSLGQTDFVVRAKKLKQRNFQLCSNENFPPNLKKFTTMPFSKLKPVLIPSLCFGIFTLFMHSYIYHTSRPVAALCCCFWKAPKGLITAWQTSNWQTSCWQTSCRQMWYFVLNFTHNPKLQMSYSNWPRISIEEIMQFNPK